jgi:signal transduction histidine kinase
VRIETDLDRPITSATGDLLGSVRIVLASDAPQPTAARRTVLERFIEQATAAIGNAIERARLAEITRLTRLGRRIVRQFGAVSSLSADGALAEMLCDAFGAVGLRLWFADGGMPTYLYSRPGFEHVYDARLEPLAYLTGRRMWPLQQVAITARDYLVNTTGSPEMLADIAANDLSSEMLVPIGFGAQYLGSLVLLRAAGAPPFSPAEREAAVEIGRDLGVVLRRARARARERQLIRDLSAVNEYRNGLIATVAARLEGPLDTIHEQLAQLVSRSGEGAIPSPRDQVAAEMIHRSAQRMSRVVDDLLLLARLAGPDRAKESEEVDLKAAVRRVADPMTAAAGRRGVHIETHLPALPVTMRGSQSDVERMLVELLSNAVKYTPRGGRVVVRLGRFDADNVLLTVADTGIGIPQDEQERVFDDFFRGSAPEVAAAGGSGLGLAIVQRIVRRHRGHVRLASEPGRGTTINVGLPLR